MYSVIETENGLHPFWYLVYVFEQLPQLTTHQAPKALEPLMPWSPLLPDSCRLT
ncbi:transposase [Paenibacillus sp. FSL H7-0331]|nr:transposase [Paenibacillus sp. FSL H7-0331]